MNGLSTHDGTPLRSHHKPDSEPIRLDRRDPPAGQRDSAVFKFSRMKTGTPNVRDIERSADQKFICEPSSLSGPITVEEEGRFATLRDACSA